MNKLIRIFSPAKVNLFLHILNKRPDGYHNLLTWFHRISLGDDLLISTRSGPDGALELQTDPPNLCPLEDNLIYRAAMLLKQISPWPGKVKVCLKKRIPVGAGLGGGSSNAAHFLMAMNDLFRFRLPKTTLLRLGGKLGADVPFFILNEAEAIASGRGEVLHSIALPRKRWFSIVILPLQLSTKRVYENWTLYGKPATGKRTKKEASRIQKWVGLTRISPAVTITSDFFSKISGRKSTFPLQNDLFEVSYHLESKIQDVYQLFLDLKIADFLMSGSGPTFFTVHQTERQARKVARQITESRSDLKVLICHTY